MPPHLILGSATTGSAHSTHTNILRVENWLRKKPFGGKHIDEVWLFDTHIPRLFLETSCASNQFVEQKSTSRTQRHMDRARRRLASAIDGIKAQFTDADSEDTADMPSTATAPPAGQQPMVRERVEPSHCRLSKIVRHGFPDAPKCMAFDPVQKLCAIGSGQGCIRLLGQAGVDQLLKHEPDEPVIHLQFLINEGGLVSALQDDTLHLWNFRQRIPEIVHSLRMSKERISTVYLPFQSRWLHVGTEKGNVYFVCLATFELSAYAIQWNKAIDLSCRTHPGAIKSLEVSPVDPTKLLIVFERGQLVLWNILTREVDRFCSDEQSSPVTAISWHFDGKQFMSGHQNGSLSIWNVKKPRELVQQSTPHAPSNDQQQQQEGQEAEEEDVQQHQQQLNTVTCKPITQLSWNVNADAEQLIIFAGGMPMDEGALPSVTVMRAKCSLTVLEMDHQIVSMLPLQASPYASAALHPIAMAVLLRNDLLVVDMQGQGYPCFEVPHPMDLHESPVTIIRYFSDCPVELIAALTLVGRNQRRQGVRLSERPWPINGGIGRECATGQQEMLLTGHEDGSIKFWQASSEQLQVMYKLKTGRHFEKTIAHIASTAVAHSGEEKPVQTPPHVSHAVADLELCSDSRQLLVASRSGQVTLFRFAKTECCQEIATVMLPQLCRTTVPTTFSPSTPPSPKDGASAGGDHSPRPRAGSQSRLKQQSRNSGSSGSVTGGGGGGRAELRRQPRTVVDASSTPAAPPGAAVASSSSRNSSHSTDTSLGSHYAEMTPLKVRGGVLRRPAGYQPELVCQIPWINGSRPERVTALALNSAHGLVALGTKVGLALVDAHTAAQIYAWSNEELLGREPIPFWSASLNSQVSEMAISPAVEQLQLTMASSSSLSTTNTPRKRHPLARALSIRSPCIKSSPSTPLNSPPIRRGSLLKKMVAIQTKLEAKFGSPKHADDDEQQRLVQAVHATGPQHASDQFWHHKKMAKKLHCRPSTPHGSETAADNVGTSLPITLVQRWQSFGTGRSTKKARLSRKHSAPEIVVVGSAAAPFERMQSDRSEDHLDSVDRHLLRSLGLLLSHPAQRQFSAQNAPKSPPPVPPAPQLSRHNTTDSATAAGQQSSTTEKFGASLNARLQRPQLVKAFTFNPTQSSSANGDGSPKEFGASPPQSAGIEPHNCNGNLSADSRASSSESLDKQKKAVSTANVEEDDEFVCSLQFINCAAKRKVPKLELCLWLGTSTGAVVAFQLQMPTNRIVSTVSVTPSGQIIRLRGRLLCCAFLDRSFCLLAGPTEQYKHQQMHAELSKDGSTTSAPQTAASGEQQQPLRPNKVITKASLSPVLSVTGTENPAAASEDAFQQLALFVSEFEVRAVQLPSYQQLFHRGSLDAEPMLKANCSHISGHPVLITLTSKGNLFVLSLPSLRTLLHVPLIGECVDMENLIFNRCDFSEHGLGIYAVTPTEVQKLTISAEIANQVNDCMGELFVPCDMPEAPKHHSFLRGILAAGASAVSGIRTGGPDPVAEMDALLREKPTTGVQSTMRTVARPLVTPQQQQQQLSGTELSTSRSVTAGQAAQQALQNLGERGERLNSTIDATDQLRNNAQAIQSRSAKLLEKYEKRKWYQL
uniref:Lethal giant larvae homologue 2 domain-containing protein n=1 Tax=Globodera rostochiensis TaxID=31243 RepID=A0A914H9C5_GLORO